MNLNGIWSEKVRTDIIELAFSKLISLPYSDNTLYGKRLFHIYTYIYSYDTIN
jgi:hypothetical protein